MGAVPMPANTQVSEAEAKTLVKWGLELEISQFELSGREPSRLRLGFLRA